MPGYVAYSKMCTHLGCPVGLYQEQTQQLVCPCHQSIFNVVAGAVPEFGPAPRPLPQLPITVDAAGYLRAQGRLQPGRRPRILGAPMIDKTIDKSLRWVDDRLGVAKGGRTFLDKIFPDHWSFMLGEIALYSFVVLLATGVFLSLYYVPSAHEIVYHGSYLPLRGQRVSEAYASSVGLSFDVRSGLLMRQAHHWAADIFLGSIAVHMARVFFTGAFRKPREFNWIVGVTMLILGIVNGFLGYSLPDDLVSGTGIRIAYSIIESIPLVGSYIAFFLFGGNYPGQRGDHPPVLHPPRADRAADTHRPARRPPRAAGQTEAHPVPGQGEDRAQRGRLARCSRPSWPRPPGSCSWSPRSSSCWAASPRSTRSGSSASTSPTRSPMPCSPTGTWAGWTGPCASCPAGSGWAGATPSPSRSSCRR